MLRRGRSVRPVNSNGIVPPPATTVGSVVTPHDLNAMIAMGTGGPMPASAPVSASAAAPVPARVSPNLSLAQIASTVQQWQQILSEVTQAVFVVVGEVVVPELPLYVDIPVTKVDAANPTLVATGTVTLLYPQFVRDEYIFMRVRQVDPKTAEVQQYYAPVAPAHDKSLLNGVYYSQYVSRFRNPGEPTPASDN
jgi:hypothetical protein